MSKFISIILYYIVELSTDGGDATCKFTVPASVPSAARAGGESIGPFSVDQNLLLAFGSGDETRLSYHDDRLGTSDALDMNKLEGNTVGEAEAEGEAEGEAEAEGESGSGCGVDHGCFGIPEGCESDKDSCNIMVTYKTTSSGDRVRARQIHSYSWEDLFLRDNWVLFRRCT